MSVPAIARKYYPWLPVDLIAKYRYATLDKIGRIRCPKLIVHSKADEIIPFEHGRKVYEKAVPPKEFLEIKGGHNEGFMLSEEAYRKGLGSFLDDCMKRAIVP